MKHFLPFLLLLFALPTFAQNVEGIVSYTEEIQNPRAEEMRQKMKARGFQFDIPDVNIDNMKLYFTKEESIYKEKEKEEKAYEGRKMGGKGMTIRFGGHSKNGYYRAIGSRDYLQEQDIMGKKFLIEDQEREYKWKITGKTEQIGQYQVMEAVTINEKDTIQAWFTPQIPIASGPAEFSQLPGLILRVDVNQGKRVIYATNIDLRPLTKEELIAKPKEGKKTTKEEFKTLQKKKLEEMKEMYGKDRGARIFEH